MQCKNHPNAAAVERCVGCAEPFCPDCLVEMHGQKYCGSCKIMALKGQPIVLEEPTIPCTEANEALTCAIIGIVLTSISMFFACGGLIGPILCLVAFSKAHKAKQYINADPRMLGSGKVMAARIIAGVVLFFFCIGIIALVFKSVR
jgi:hypothetical protein